MDEHNSAVRKVTRRVMPLLLAGWFLAYLDRFNVGFAALQMNSALGMTAAQFGFGAGIFFLSYSALEIPSNLLLARFGPRIWLGRIMITWGLVTASMVLTAGPLSFYVFRLLLGAAEAGCFPGIAFYLSLMLPLRDRAFALAKIGSITQVAIIAGGPLAGLLLALNGIGGLAGWQWLFLVEGVPAVVVGMCVLRWLPDDLRGVKTLTDSERKILAAGCEPDHSSLSIRDSLRIVIYDKRNWGWAAVFFAYNVGSSGLRVWQPTMLRALSGAGDVTIGLLSAIPPIIGAAAILTVGYSSTKRQERRWHITAPMLLAVIGLLLVSRADSAVACVAAASIASIGVACQPALFASVTSASNGASRAVAVAFVNSVALCGSFWGPYLVGYMQGILGSLTSPYAFISALVMAGAMFNLSIREQRTAVRGRHAIERELEAT